MNRFKIYIVMLFLAYLLEGNPTNLDTSFNSSGTGSNVPGTVIFNPSGATETFNNAIQVQSDGKILCAGYTTISGVQKVFVARFLANGTPDTTFNTTGYNITTVPSSSQAKIMAMAIDPQTQKIVCAGSAVTSSYYSLVLRYNTNGTLDTSFNSSGILTLQIPTSTAGSATDVTVQSDSKILLTGEFNGWTGIWTARILANGSGLDTSFNTTGYTTLFSGNGIASGHAVGIDPNGKIIVAGRCTQASIQYPIIIRYQSNGALDSTFNTSSTPGYNILNVPGLALTQKIQSNGYILIAGSTMLTSNPTPFFFARYTSTGILDTTLNATNTPGYILTQIQSTNSTKSIAQGIDVQTNGNIIISGNTTYSGNIPTKVFFARYTTNGTLDTTFAPGGYVVSPVQADDPAEIDGLPVNTSNNLIVQSNEKFIVPATATQNSTKIGVTARFLGGNIIEPITSSISSYGINASFIDDFLYQSFYVTLITDQTARAATLTAINSIISSYTSSYINQPSFNYLSYLYLIQADFDALLPTLLATYTSSEDQIELCFEYLNDRIVHLTGT